MTDVLSTEQRRFCMSRIRDKNTKPEIIVRQLVRQMGIGYRLHVKDLPGKPDLVFRKHNKIIFVHGCFWHMHTCKYGRVVPKTNAEFWQTKRLSNKLRDSKNRKELKKLGWKVLVIWECQTKKTLYLVKKLQGFFSHDAVF
ncbi:MAG: very short patch repair endonuclease [Candidatus Riflebacteria bacterium]|nr:very short patch repair endonuclease [Candidatus Riflebacteria bacterium]